MEFGVRVLAIAGLVWGVIGVLAAPISPVWLVIPFVVAATIATTLSRSTFATAQSGNESVRALTMRWTIAESVGIILAVIVLFALHRPVAIGPVAAIIVGLHFLPLAHGVPMQTFYATGGAMILAGIVTLIAIPPPLMLAVAAVSVAVIMWLSAVAILRVNR